jgi:ferric-dicitrate binding protein FerR (iron transport regulator)
MTIPPSDDINWALAQYLAVEADDETSARVRAWAERDPANARYLENLSVVWERSAQGARQWDVEAALERVKRAPANAQSGTRAARTIRFPVRHAERGVGSRYLSIATRAAAVLLIAAGATFAFHHPHGDAAQSVASNEMMEIATTPGQRAIATLSDGSQVILGPASHLRYARSYGHPRRDVYLEGQGYFTVTHDSTRPFQVHTGNAIASDLGTKFVVRAYAVDSTVDVVVEEGKVSLRSAAASDSVVLTHAEMGQVGADGTLRSVHDVAVDDAIAWTDGRLVFHDTPFADVTRALERWYNIDVSASDTTLLTRHLTATFTDEPLNNVLQLIARSMRLTVEWHGRTVVLRRA